MLLHGISAKFSDYYETVLFMNYNRSGPFLKHITAIDDFQILSQIPVFLVNFHCCFPPQKHHYPSAGFPPVSRHDISIFLFTYWTNLLMICLYFLILDKSKVRSKLLLFKVLHIDFLSFEIVFERFHKYFNFILAATARFPPPFYFPLAPEYFPPPQLLLIGPSSLFFFAIFVFFVTSTSSSLFQTSSGVKDMVPKSYKTAVTISLKVSSTPSMYCKLY